MSIGREKVFSVHADTKSDKRLTRMLLRLGVLSSEDVKTRLSSLKDLEDKIRFISMEQVTQTK